MFLLLLLLIAAYLRVVFFFTIVAFLLLLFLVSLWWVRRDARALSIRRRYTDHAFTGDEVRVEVEVVNPGRLPVPWVTLDESVPTELAPGGVQLHAMSVGAGATERFSYVLRCRKRGYYKLGPMRIQTGDLLGIRQRDLGWAPEPMIVYPRVIPLERLGLPTRSALVALPSRSPLFEDPSRVMGVRPYRQGDTPRRMHWKASARTGSLLVKQFQPAVARETLIWLDMRTDAYGRVEAYEAIEWAIVVAASIAQHIVVREGLPVGFAADAWDPIPEAPRRFLLPAGAHQAGLMSLLEILARIGPVEGGDAARVVRERAAELAWGSTIVAITGTAGADLLPTLGEAARGGIATVLLLAQPALLDPALVGRARAMDVAVHRLWTDRDLEALA